MLKGSPGFFINKLSKLPYLKALIRKHDRGNDKCKKQIKCRIRKIIKNTFPKACAKATRPHNIKYHINSLISTIRTKRKHKHKHKRNSYLKKSTHFPDIIPNILLEKLSKRLSNVITHSSTTLRQCKRIWTNWCQRRNVWDNRLFKHVSKCYKQARKRCTKRPKGRTNFWKAKKDKDETLLVTSWNIDKGFTKVHHFITEEPQACIYALQETAIEDNRRPPNLASGWNWSSQARSTNKGGGTGFCILKGLNWSLIQSLCKRSVNKAAAEWTVLKILSLGPLPLIIYNVYFPPSLKTVPKELCNSIKDSVSTGAVVLLVGDINHDLNSKNDQFSGNLRDYLSLCGQWKELVRDVTHYPPQTSLKPHKLDSAVVIGRSIDQLKSFRADILPPPNPSCTGHCRINVYCNRKAYHVPNVTKKPKFSRLNNKVLSEKLQLLIDEMIPTMEKLSSYKDLIKMINVGCCKTLGTRPFRQLISNRQKPFWSPTLTTAQKSNIRTRRKYFKRRNTVHPNVARF